MYGANSAWESLLMYCQVSSYLLSILYSEDKGLEVFSLLFLAFHCQYLEVVFLDLRNFHSAVFIIFLTPMDIKKETFF